MTSSLRFPDKTCNSVVVRLYTFFVAIEILSHLCDGAEYTDNANIYWTFNYNRTLRKQLSTFNVYALLINKY